MVHLDLARQAGTGPYRTHALMSAAEWWGLGFCMPGICKPTHPTLCIHAQHTAHILTPGHSFTHMYSPGRASTHTTSSRHAASQNTLPYPACWCVAAVVAVALRMFWRLLLLLLLLLAFVMMTQRLLLSWWILTGKAPLPRSLTHTRTLCTMYCIILRRVLLQQPPTPPAPWPLLITPVTRCPPPGPPPPLPAGGLPRGASADGGRRDDP